MLIEVEGIDAAGKSTLVGNLTAFYTGKGKKVLNLNFPDHTSLTGSLIRQWLGEKWTTGEFARDALVHQCLQIVNRLDLLSEHDQSAFDHIIVDRYYTSTIVYGSMDGLDVKWLRRICSMLPQPDISIFLKIPVEESFKRRTEGRDRYERDPSYLIKVAKAYDEEAQRDKEGCLRLVLDTTNKTKQEVLMAAVQAIEGAKT